MMSYWILPTSGIPISATTVQRMTNDECNTDEIQEQITAYSSRINKICECKSAELDAHIYNVDSSKIINPDDKDPTFFEEFTRVIDNTHLPHADDNVKGVTVEVGTDPYLRIELGLVRGGEGEMMHAKVVRRSQDPDRQFIGVANANPLLDSWNYEVEYSDGNVENLTANIIAENLIAQVDEEGQRQMMLSEIIDHQILHDAIPKSEGTNVNSYGVKRHKITTRGWELLVEWQDDSSDWVAIKDLKEMNQNLTGGSLTS
jgi:hypothetical protein